MRERLEAVERVTIIDIHSYPLTKNPYELHGDGPRPEVCIGTDAFHTSAALAEAATSSLANAAPTGEVGLNSPFAGCYVPLDQYEQTTAVQAVMLEIRRDVVADRSHELAVATAALIDTQEAEMNLTSAQMDRACGVLLASAAGDALGAGYEFRHDLADVVPAMIGGGLGNFAPGEWTDDTAQAVAIAVVAADGLDLRTPEALDRIAQGFADWYAAGPPDVGIQTSAVLSRAGRNPTGVEMAAAAAEVHAALGPQRRQRLIDAHRPGRAGLPERPERPRRGRQGRQPADPL